MSQTQPNDAAGNQLGKRLGGIDRSIILVLITTNMNASRAYAMTTRAAAAAGTRARILRALVDLSMEKLTIDIVLGDVAARAGVSVQTILRHFGSREGLFDVAVDFAAAEVVEERIAPVGDAAAAVRVIVDHYELRGDWVIAMLGQEMGDARIRRITELGRQTHRVWVETVFAAQPKADEQLRDLLVVATDVYAWKLLRRDRGLDRDGTERSMLRLVNAVLARD
jgi:AcrR family transcriptional regulator